MQAMISSLKLTCKTHESPQLPEKYAFLAELTQPPQLISNIEIAQGDKPA